MIFQGDQPAPEPPELPELRDSREPGASETDAAFRRLAGGDLGGLEELYDLEADGLFALALWITGSREDAADAVQQVFVKLATRRRTLGGVRKPRPYLLAMIRSAATDRLRAARPRAWPEARSDAPEDDLLLEAAPADPAAGVDAEAASRHLRRLPLRQREAVYLRYFAELSFAEIGRVTGVSLFTAASRCRLGLQKLRKWMGVEP
ncbi:MAG: RNA polymerase sigma factor [Acidobacteriota bacterium]|jgi:RNA polymerase sigma factor (sigma-70 family)